MKRNGNKSNVFTLRNFGSHLYWGVLFWFVYNRIFFRCITDATLFESRMLLLLILLLSEFLGMTVDYKAEKEEFFEAYNLLIGFAFYTAATYIDIKKTVILACVFISTAVISVYGIRAYYIRIKTENPQADNTLAKFKNIAKIKSVASYCAIGTLLAIGLPMVISGYLFKPSVKPAKASDDRTWALENCIDTFTMFNEDTWKTLSIEEKLDVCQTLANYEREIMCIPNELNVVSGNAEEDDVYGFYEDRKHMIVIDIDHLMNDKGWEVCDTVAHEAYHCLQYRLVDAYNKADEESRQLYIFNLAEKYKEEFDHYDDGSKDFYAYSSQYCERMAADYAEDETEEIRYLVNSYLSGELDF